MGIEIIEKMRSVILPLAILDLLTVGTFAADAKAEEKVESVDDSAEDDPAKQAKEELDKIDGNKDGKADLAEINAYMKKEFYGPEDIKDDKLSPPRSMRSLLLTPRSTSRSSTRTRTASWTSLSSLHTTRRMRMMWTRSSMRPATRMTKVRMTRVRTTSKRKRSVGY